MGPTMCQAKITNRDPIFYFNQVKENQLDTQSAKQKVQLFLSLSRCTPGSNYSINVVSYSSPNQESQSNLGQTESSKANQQDIKFNKFIVMEYYFEREQHLGFIVTKEGQTSVIKITLGRIMGSRGLVYSTDVSSGEKLIVTGKSLDNDNVNALSAYFEVSLSGALNGRPYCFSLKNMGTQNNPSNTIIYRSEIKESQGSITFNPVTLPAQYLCNGDLANNLVSLEILVNGAEKIGEHIGMMNQFIDKPKTINLNASGGNKTATVKAKIKKEHKFLDFLRGGMQIGLTIAIDFTGSNREPIHPSSLHNITGNQMNLYETAIKSCGDIVAYYDYDQLFPVYGYGAIVQGETDVNHCFPLNGSSDPNIHTINNILSCYRAMVPTLRFYGPTCFAPIISALNNMVKQDLAQGKEMNYNILMILTDGQINDMKETIDAVVDASYLPISIIIIGIGLGDFGNMDTLDADDSPLYDSRGRKAARDLVQFVPFHKYSNDGVKLCEEVLEEIPRQVCQYYQMKEIIPGDPIVNIAI